MSHDLEINLQCAAANDVVHTRQAVSGAGGGLEGADGVLPLSPAGKKLPKQVRQKFPFLDGCMVFKLAPDAQSQVCPCTPITNPSPL